VIPCGSERRRKVVLEECLACCDRLIRLLERDRDETRDVLRGELYDAYEGVLMDEIKELKIIERELRGLW